MNRLLLVLLLALAIAGAQDRRLVPSAPGRRLALVVGNARYPAGALRNPVNDSLAVAVALRESGFDVWEAPDAGQQALDRAISAFVASIRPGDVALFYYSGHGVQVDGENYILPIDFNAEQEADVRYRAYPAGRVLDKLNNAGAGLGILILDACRDNPFRVSKSGTHGLAPMNTGKGSFIAFATSPGATASDNAGETNGLFTKHLLEALNRPGLKLSELFDQVRERVYTASGGRQVPWTSSSVVGPFVFRDPAEERAKLERELAGLERRVADKVERDMAAAAIRVKIEALPSVPPPPVDTGIEELRRRRDVLQTAAGDTLTLEQAQAEVASLESRIAGVKKDYDAVRDEALRRLPSAEKDLFETTAEYEARKPKAIAARADVEKRYRAEFETAVQPERERIAKLKARTYPIVGAKVEFVGYDADAGLLTAKVNGEECVFTVAPPKARSLYEQTALVRGGRSFADARALSVIDPSTGESFPGAGTKVNPKDGLRYIWIPPGTFTMGCSPGGEEECDPDEKPAHQVTLTKGFWIGQTEVTKEAYPRVVGGVLAGWPGRAAANIGLPIAGVTWNDAQAYCKAVGMRLPTEAEWEYGARGGNTSARYGPIDSIAWYDGNSLKEPHAVGRKQANAFGLFDMLGNVWEWVLDWYGPYPNGNASDPQGPSTGTRRVLRGGSWYNDPRTRASVRSNWEPQNRSEYIGVRCAGETLPRAL